MVESYNLPVYIFIQKKWADLVGWQTDQLFEVMNDLVRQTELSQITEIDWNCGLAVIL